MCYPKENNVSCHQVADSYTSYKQCLVAICSKEKLVIVTDYFKLLKVYRDRIGLCIKVNDNRTKLNLNCFK